MGLTLLCRDGFIGGEAVPCRVYLHTKQFHGKFFFRKKTTHFIARALKTRKNEISITLIYCKYIVTVGNSNKVQCTYGGIEMHLRKGTI